VVCRYVPGAGPSLVWRSLQLQHTHVALELCLTVASMDSRGSTLASPAVQQHCLRVDESSVWNWCAAVLSHGFSTALLDATCKRLQCSRLVTATATAGHIHRMCVAAARHQNTSAAQTKACFNMH